MWGFPNAAPPAGGQGMPVNPWMFAQPGMLPHPSMYSQFAPQEGMPQGMPVPPAAERELEPSAGGKAKRRKKKEKKVGSLLPVAVNWRDQETGAQSQRRGKGTSSSGSSDPERERGWMLMAPPRLEALPPLCGFSNTLCSTPYAMSNL